MAATKQARAAAKAAPRVFVSPALANARAVAVGSCTCSCNGAEGAGMGAGKPGAPLEALEVVAASKKTRKTS